MLLSTWRWLHGSAVAVAVANGIADSAMAVCLHSDLRAVVPTSNHAHRVFDDRVRSLYRSNSRFW